jgi:hypothetical protein
VRLGRHRRRGRFARTNRPERFVGNGDSCKLLARKHAHAVAKLLSDHVSRVLLFEFSYANNRYETGLQRGQNLLRYGFICFAKILAPVAVAHNHMRTARCPNHRTRNLSGVGSFFCPVQVLSANLYLGPAGGADRCFELRNGGQITTSQFTGGLINGRKASKKTAVAAASYASSNFLQTAESESPSNAHNGADGISNEPISHIPHSAERTETSAPSNHENIGTRFRDRME